MSEDIDFVMPEFKKIERPERQIKAIKPEDKKKPTSKSFQIQKSFVSEPVSKIHENLRPELNQLKKFIKLKKQREKR